MSVIKIIRTQSLNVHKYKLLELECVDILLDS
jgi:hypothetical protein